MSSVNAQIVFIALGASQNVLLRKEKKNMSIFTHDISISQQPTFTRVTHKGTAETNNIVDEYA